MILFFFTVEEYSTVYHYHIFIIHSSIEKRLRCFRFLAGVNKVAKNIAEFKMLGPLDIY